MKRFENDELSGYLFDEAAKQGLVTVEQDKTTHEYVAVDSDIERQYLRTYPRSLNPTRIRYPPLTKPNYGYAGCGLLYGGCGFECIILNIPSRNQHDYGQEAILGHRSVATCWPKLRPSAIFSFQIDLFGFKVILCRPHRVD
jgi:hypothetical protein